VGMPPGCDAYPASGFPPTVPGGLTTTCYVSRRSGPVNAWGPSRGPYKITRVPVSGNVQVADPLNGGLMVTIEEKWWLPIQSKVAPRCMVWDIATQVYYDVVATRQYSTFIECFVARRTAQT
jgi:hypothetical protein